MTEPDLILSSAGTGTLSTWTGIDPADRPKGASEPETDIGHVLQAGTGTVSTWTGKDPATASHSKAEAPKAQETAPAK